MSRSLNVTINGKPQQQGSKSAYVIKGRAVMTEANKNLMPWRKAATPIVQAAAVEQGWIKPGTDEPVTLNVAFYFDRPKTVRRKFMTTMPDLDKTLRAVLDLLSHPGAGVIPDDAQVTTITTSKHYGEARTEIALFY